MSTFSAWLPLLFLLSSVPTSKASASLDTASGLAYAAASGTSKCLGGRCVLVLDGEDDEEVQEVIAGEENTERIRPNGENRYYLLILDFLF